MSGNETMTIISSLQAFIYCADHRSPMDELAPNISGEFRDRWCLLRNLLETNRIPALLALPDQHSPPSLQTTGRFQFSASIDTKEQLCNHLSLKFEADASNILVAGCYAETLVTDVALTALEEGYDTYIIWDRVWAIDDFGLESAKSRLLQAGAVPTSINQVLHHWG